MGKISGEESLQGRKSPGTQHFPTLLAFPKSYSLAKPSLSLASLFWSVSPLRALAGLCPRTACFHLRLGREAATEVRATQEHRDTASSRRHVRNTKIAPLFPGMTRRCIPSTLDRKASDDTAVTPILRVLDKHHGQNRQATSSCISFPCHRSHLSRGCVPQ